MSEPGNAEQGNAEQGVAEALHGLGEQTRHLVRAEMGAARREMWEKARRSTPTLALLGGAGLLGLFAVASTYRLGMRLLEHLMPPGLAAAFAAAGCGAGAGWAAIEGTKRLRDLPVPLPTDTAKEAARETGTALARERDAR